MLHNLFAIKIVFTEISLH